MKIFNSVLLLVMVCFVIDGNHLVGQEKPIETVFDNGETQILVPKYEDQPESVRARLSRDEYEKIYNIYSVRPQLDFMNSFEGRSEKVFAIYFRSFSRFQATINRTKELPAIYESLEFSDSQLNAIKKIESNLELERKKLEEQEISSQDVLDAEREAIAQLGAVLLPFQMDALTNLETDNGLPKLLTETPYGDMIGLTAGQRERIRQKSQILADEVREFILRKRMDARSIVISEITAEQLEKLHELFDQNELEKRANVMSAENIWRVHNYSNRNEENPDRKK